MQTPRTGSGGILLTVRWEMSSAAATSIGSPRRISVMPAACMATSVPLPMAMPTSAAARAGASFTRRLPSPQCGAGGQSPAPTFYICSVAALQQLDLRSLVAGQHLGHHLACPRVSGPGGAPWPRPRPGCRRDLPWRMPRALSSASASTAPGLGSSPKASKASMRPCGFGPATANYCKAL